MFRSGTLIDQSYGVNVTPIFQRKFAMEFNKREKGADGKPVTERNGPIRSAPLSFTLIGGAPSIVISQMNVWRRGLLIQNRDPTATLFVGFGMLADANSFNMAPGGYILLDFICPADPIAVFGTANVSGYICEWAPTG